MIIVKFHSNPIDFAYKEHQRVFVWEGILLMELSAGLYYSRFCYYSLMWIVVIVHANNS